MVRPYAPARVRRSFRARGAPPRVSGVHSAPVVRPHAPTPRRVSGVHSAPTPLRPRVPRACPAFIPRPWCAPTPPRPARVSGVHSAPVVRPHAPARVRRSFRARGAPPRPRAARVRRSLRAGRTPPRPRACPAFIPRPWCAPAPPRPARVSGVHSAPPRPHAPTPRRVSGVHSAPVVRPHAPASRARLAFGVHSAPAAPPRPRPAPAIRRDHSGKRRCRLFPVRGWSAIAERQQLVNRLIDR